ncbi:MAG: Ig-like domain-containing protein, partial [Planctomycetota bacterium]
MNRPQRLASAARFVVEQLEGRRLLAFTGVNFDLPLQLTFDGESNGVQDVDGQNTGFPIVQGNADGNEYDSSLIDLDTDAGLLLVTSAGDAIDGSNFGTDNSLVNGLQLPFDGSADWLVYTKVGLSGDTLDGFDTAFEQAGIMVGPTQDNYVKLVFGHDGTQNTVQFLAEQPDGSGGLTFALGNGGATSLPAGQTGVDLSTARFVDLWLAGDASTGEITAQYRVEGGVMVRLPQTFTAPQTDFFRVNGNRAGLIAVHKNNGDAITAAFDEFAVTNDTLPGTQPVVLEARPNDGEELVDRGAFVAVDLFLPNASVAGATLDGNVTLTRVSDGLVVPATLNTTGGGDSIVVTPDRALDADTEYRFDVTAGVTDLLGVAFQPFSSTFATGFTLGTDAGVAGLADVAFEQVDLPDTVGTAWAGVTVGPDNRLYGLAVTGEIFRYNIASDGTLSNETLIDSLNDSEGEQRLATGLAFAPNATSSNLVAYITHTQLNPLSTNIPADLGDDFTGKITRLSGSNLQNAQTLVEGLPRSTRDHVTNQPVFGPDGLLYFVQASNSAMGAPDPAWGNRPERPLSGAVLAADVKALSQRSTPLDVTTPDGGGTYDPDVPGALVSVYAEGIRNAYDLVFHSNGRLYSPANGSAAGGNAPAGPGGFPPAINGVSNTQGDYLYDVIEGGYYGHPNPSQGNFVLSGGNPTAGVDPAEVPDYPVGTQPQNDYQGFAFDFGLNESPNGAVEYGLSGSGSFNGDLDGKLIVTRFSGSDDLIVLDVDETGGIRQGVTDIPGFDGFSNPLDLAEGPGGVLYVAQFGDREGEVPMVDPNTQRITLLRPVAAGGEASVDRRRIFIDAAANTSEERPLTVRNLGTEPLVVSPYTLGLTGPDKDLF